MIVAGDLNATYAAVPTTARRRLSRCGRAGRAGLTRSFPNTAAGAPWRRPVVGIDHVLVRNCVVTAAGTVSMPGSDHRGLLKTIEIPADPTASYPV
ncbi:endonuclease/exonuclease/phosphatase family protein [Mycolicibacterium rhodesiae]|uniref:endonuclease/exonuclease/phosphatase family protein n=1 Tax=Mycolicibacterium rhodesiae TaxID=36814 RepID=UPI00022E3FBA|nr:endonuclease/exonuclease/phosphatase family protein [Mycolicibacterium rhodesiae]